MDPRSVLTTTFLLSFFIGSTFSEVLLNKYNKTKINRLK
jgi:hypothetical protein